MGLGERRRDRGDVRRGNAKWEAVSERDNDTCLLGLISV